jgi:transcriptional/translational regulatory protein YebC/TACO1
MGVRSGLLPQFRDLPAEVAQRPKTLVPLDEEGATKLMKLIDALEDLDDVDAVHANFDVPADVLERVAG